MIVLFTDFGARDIYTGQVHAVLAERAPGIAVIDLLHDAPVFDVQSSGYLLHALQRCFPAGSVFMAVVDPGVGGSRAPLMLNADGKWFVGPDNGLLSRVVRDAAVWEAYEVVWRPPHMSQSFHGRDLFAPVVAMLAAGDMPEYAVVKPKVLDWADILDRIIYIDHYGNALTGRAEGTIDTGDSLVLRGREIRHSRIFGENETAGLFWYVNSLGLVEIAANRASAGAMLNLEIGDVVDVVPARNGGA